MKVKYNHPSIPRIAIDINRVQIVKQIEDKYFICEDGKEIEISLADLNTLFLVVEEKQLEKSEKAKEKYKNYKKNNEESIE